MSNVKVMTDSVAGIPQNLAKEYQIKVIPAANIHYNGTTYVDGVTLNAAEAYKLIKKDPDRFTTSALNPGYFLEEFKKLNQKDLQLIHLSLSSALSATFKTASMGADMYIEEFPGSRISVVDTLACASTQGLVVLAVAKAAAQGKGLDNLIEYSKYVRQQTRGIMMLDTLRYVYRTGRMSKLGSRIASLFNIKPINELTDAGKIELWDRVRDREKGYQKIVDYVKEKASSKSLHFMVMHADAPEMANTMVSLLKQEFDCLSVIISEYSPIMGYGAGPGCIFVGFHPELK